MRRSNPNKLEPQGGIETTKPMLDGKPNDIRSFRVSFEEAKRLVKRSQGRTFSLHCRQWAYARDQSQAGEGQSMGRDVSSFLTVTRKQLLGYMDAAYGTRTRDECYVTISICDNIFFVG